MVRLDDNYWLEADRYNWVLRYKKITMIPDPATGELRPVTSTDESFHGKLDFALKAYCDKCLKNTGSVDQIRSMITDLHARISGMSSLITSEARVSSIKDYPATPEESYSEDEIGLEPKHGPYNGTIPDMSAEALLDDLL